MMRLLLFIKHHLGFLWSIAEFGNGLLFRVLFGKKFEESVRSACAEFSGGEITFRPVHDVDIAPLSAFFHSQPDESYRYFRPHAFDERTLRRLWKNPSFFQMLAVTADERIAGYFMIRCFVNRQSFAGFLVGQDFRGRGIAKKMCRIIFKICWPNRFRTFATVSKKNGSALAAYRSINDFKILKELPDDYIYIEYTPEGLKQEGSL